MHAANTGFVPVDHIEVREQLAAALAPRGIGMLDPCHRAGKRTYRKVRPAENRGQAYTLEIWTQSALTREAVLAALEHHHQLRPAPDPHDPAITHFTGDLALTVILKDAGALGAGLDRQPDDARPESTRLGAHASHVAGHLGPSPDTRAAILELEDDRYFHRAGQIDPKPALKKHSPEPTAGSSACGPPSCSRPPPARRRTRKKSASPVPLGNPVSWCELGFCFGISTVAGNISECRCRSFYRLVRCLVGLLAMLVRSDLSKDVELLVLRHENQVLRRQLGGRRRRTARYKKRGMDRSLRERGKRRPGKQPGQPGATMKLVDDPDDRFEYPPAACTGCGADLAGEPVAAQRRHQVTDIEPAPAPKVTEHVAQAKECPCCGTLTEGELPAHVRARASYGPETCAQAANLAVGHHIPIWRSTVLLCQLAGIAVSTGWMAGIRGKACSTSQIRLQRLTWLVMRRAGTR